MQAPFVSSQTLQLQLRQNTATENFEGLQTQRSTLRPLPDSQVCSTDILRGQRERDIAHNGCVYRLQVTRLGKLILTK